MTRNSNKEKGFVVNDKPEEWNLQNTLLSVFASFIVLNLFVDAKLATVILLGFLAHEAGHCIAYRFYGKTITSVIITPISGTSFHGGDAIVVGRQDIVVSLSGPIFGLTYAVGLLVLSIVSKDISLFSLIPFVVMWNVMELLPIPMLDGSVFLRLGYQAFTKHNAIT